jgi:hypothetical protein
MPGETATYAIKYPIAGDEVRVAPTEVFQPGAEKIDTVLKEKILIFKPRAASYEAKSGELGEQSSAGATTTLPLAATANQIIGVFCTATSCKITTSGGAFIVGDFITIASKTAIITLTEGQHVVLQSGGTNWAIIAGEPKREQKYVTKTFTKAEGEAGVTPSATRPAVVSVTAGGGEFTEGTVGAVQIMETGAGGIKNLFFEVPPGQAWKITTSGVNFFSSTLLK